MKKFQVIAGTIAAILLISCSEGGGADLGPAPSFKVESYETPGKMVSLEDLKGKVVVLDFWATWCAPCRESIPHLNEISKTYAKDGLQIVAITDETRGEVKPFLSKFDMHYPIFLDPMGEANRAYNITGIPTTVIINKQGNVVFSGSPFERKEMAQAIESSL